MPQHKTSAQLCQCFICLNLRFTLLAILVLLVILPSGHDVIADQSQIDMQEKNARTGVEIPFLEPGKGLESELSGGQMHGYQVKLTEGQYLSLVVEQRGIDVVVILFEPEGKQLVEVDSPNGDNGPEKLQYITEKSGVFRVEIRALEKRAKAGRYAIQLAELRKATGRDPVLLRIEFLLVKSRIAQAKRDYQGAIVAGEEILTLREQIWGAEHLEVADTLVAIASLHMSTMGYVKAERFFLRALNIRGKLSLLGDLKTAELMGMLANLYGKMRQPSQAEQYHQQALAIFEKQLGPNHFNVGRELNNLGITFQSINDYERAERYFQRALEVWEKAAGLESNAVELAVNNLAENHYQKREYEKGDQLLQQYLGRMEKHFGAEHLKVGIAYLHVGDFYSDQRNKVKAEWHLQRALAILERAEGAYGSKVASALFFLGMLYRNAFDFVRAEPLLLRSFEIRQKEGNESDLLTAIIHLGEMYRDWGDYVNAEKFYLLGLEEIRKKEGPDSGFAFRLNLGDIYRASGEYKKADEQLKIALQQSLKEEESAGLPSPDVALVLFNLGLVSYQKGELAQSEVHYLDALSRYEKAGRGRSSRVYSLLCNLAEVYLIGQQYGKAEKTLEQAQSIAKSIYRDNSPELREVLSGLADLHLARGENQQAISLWQHIQELSEDTMKQVLAAGSERQKLAFLSTLEAGINDLISLHIRQTPNNSSAGDLAAVTIIRHKGRVQDAIQDSLSILRQRSGSQDQPLFDQLQETSERLARFSLSRPQGMTIAEQQKEIRNIEIQREAVEAEISRRSDEFRSQAQPVTLENVRSLIPFDAALVEFAVYRPFNPKATSIDRKHGVQQYVAYVLSRKGDIKAIQLGEVDAANAAIDAWRQALRDPDRKDVKELSRALDKLVMQPLRPLLDDAKHLLISPDGKLNLVPFAALVDEQGQYLAERYSISYLTSGRDLLRLQVARNSKSTSLVIADPEYGEEVSQQASVTTLKPKGTSGSKLRQSVTVADDLSSLYFLRAKDTVAEARAIRALFPDAKVMTGRLATETVLKQAVSPRILHIATHGFFLKSQDQIRSEVDLRNQEGTRAINANTKITNPLLRSGLALAGANLHKTDNQDGILTAMEAAGLNLWGTKLVVLSACETGVGEVRTGEGVFGLRRALVLAGSETQVMSLWSVDSAVTRDWMTKYYTRLKQGQGRGEALRQVQLEMMKQKRLEHPFFWAGFIQSGQWSPLDR